MNAREIPLSGYARRQLSENWGDYWGPALGISFLVGIVSFIVGVSLGTWPKCGFVFLGGTAVILTAWTISGLVGGRDWKRGQSTIILKNEVDYNRSLQLEEGLQRFETARASDFPVKEKSVAGDWKPFRIEHFVSNSLRGEIVGETEHRGSILFGNILSGTLRGSVKGFAVPNLLDLSSVLFLKGPNGTLRVLLPSPRATRELLVKTLELWLSEIPQDSHTYKALQEFSMTDDHLLSPISHPKLVDSLDASCDMLTDKRPSVGVIGEIVQDGVALATALEVNGRQNVFLPSGFFKELSVLVAPCLKQASGPIMLTAV